MYLFCIAVLSVVVYLLFVFCLFVVCCFQVLALCVEVQESESANIVSFSPYYPGCIPLLVINHFSDLSLRFAQSIK